MRVKFDETMGASNNLILDEWKAQALARRLREQNECVLRAIQFRTTLTADSQILELLLDMNETARLPSNLRIDLREPSEIAANANIETDPQLLQERLHDLRTQLTDGIISADEYTARADQLHNSQSVQLTHSLANIEAKVPHTTAPPDSPIDGIDLSETAPGYMSPTHEEEYLLAMDVALADPGVQDGRIRIPQTHPAPTEKDLTVRNPDSVYNWLRKHQPQVFLQDKDPQHLENLSEKSAARAGGAGRGKRQSAITGTPGPKTDPDDEDGFVAESGGGNGKGRKSKAGDEDPAYRPKGGSSRPSKRKREDGEVAPKGTKKKTRMSTGTVA